MIWIIEAAEDPGIGGVLQCVPHTEWDKQDPRIWEYILTNDVKFYHHLKGDVYFLKSDTTLHKVVPIQQETTRIILNTCWASAHGRRSETVAIVLSLWWLFYIYGIMSGRVLEVAFGYFLSPIMSMVVSRLIFKERLSSLQLAAFSLALAGVLLMAFELLNPHLFPWIAIIIGFCYSFYDLFKKKVPGDPVVV